MKLKIKKIINFLFARKKFKSGITPQFIYTLDKTRRIFNKPLTIYTWLNCYKSSYKHKFGKAFNCQIKNLYKE